MSNYISKRQILRRTLLLGLLITVAGSPAQSFAGSTEAPTGLKPETRAAVRGVGHALLQAKRRYTPQQDISALRDRIKQVRRLVKTLTAPVTASTWIKVVTSTPSAASSSTTPAVSQAPDWRQVRAGEIQQLQSATARLRQQCQALRKSVTPAARKTSLFDTVVRYFSGRPATSMNGKPNIIAPVTSVALARLEQLDTEVTDAIALPAAERQQRLKAMSVALRPGKQRTGIRDNTTEVKPTPTFTTRTQHRRSW